MSTSSPKHPGQYVREKILNPKKLSVTAAAKLIGISRPGVSNFLNGKVSATPEMAKRLEKVFEISAKEILDMQAKYDAEFKKRPKLSTPSNSFVAPFLQIRANQIEDFGERNISARTRLAVLLRTLIHSTGSGLMHVDFPGNDDGELPGWDGQVEATEATAWIPAGKSGWEFGTNADVKKKADGDFAKSVKSTKKSERVETVYIFVTTRRWKKRKQWEEEANKKGLWKKVLAYDATVLEQWLEQSLAGQTWLASELKIPSDGVESLDQCWRNWSDVTNPVFPVELFHPAIEASKKKLLSYLEAQPSRPFIIAADSLLEGKAFVSAALTSPDTGIPEKYKDNALVFEKIGTATRLSASSKSFIAITSKIEIEHELAPLASKLHSIIICPRNSTGADAQVVLEQIPHDIFRQVLEDNGKSRDEIDLLNRESGRSLTVLRRRLSNIKIIQRPEWIAKGNTVGNLAPYLFVGAWASRNEADIEALSLLTNIDSYYEIEKEFQKLSVLDDTPVWSAGTYRGVVSKIDLLFAVADQITIKELNNFWDLAKLVLGEDDPALDLPEEKRMFASLYDKTREFSAAFRNGISETLVLLSVHGNNLFQERLGVNVEYEVAKVIEELLPSPLTARTLEANNRDLPTYAEAAPDKFLSIIETDLNSEKPACYELLRPVDSSIFGSHPARTGLLWALEGLSWNPKTMPWAVNILANLAQIEINDNWMNKPINSLHSIFRASMPQTAASHEQRLHAVKLIAKKYPDIGWSICIGQFQPGLSVGDYTHKPNWRSDGFGFGEPFKTRKPVDKFVAEMVNMSLNWGNYSCEKLCDLVECIDNVDEKSQAIIWKHIEEWAQRSTSDEDKAMLRETLKQRVRFKSRHGKDTKGYKKFNTKAKTIYKLLEPQDVITANNWLFKEYWVSETADELDQDDIDYDKRDEAIRKKRKDAIDAIYNTYSEAGIIHLARENNTAHEIGILFGEITDKKDLSNFISTILDEADVEQNWKLNQLLAGILKSITDDEERRLFILNLAESLPDNELSIIARNAPFRRFTWGLLSELGASIEQNYWLNVVPNWIHDSETDLEVAIKNLLKVNRPRAAFCCIRFRQNRIDPKLLFKLLSEAAKEGNDKAGEYKLDHYAIEGAFKQLNDSNQISLDDMAGLEYLFMEVISSQISEKHKYGIPNLEKYITKNPELFVQSIVAAFKRRNGGKDPSEYRLPDENKKLLAERAHSLLRRMSRIPMYDHEGSPSASILIEWIKAVRETCRKLDRIEVADICIGELLAKAPNDEDGNWPCDPVKDAIEQVQSNDLSRGVRAGLFNSRGAHWRGEGGQQEREIAERYQNWGQAVQYSHPYLSRVLFSMSDSYLADAKLQDIEAGIRNRLND